MTRRAKVCSDGPVRTGCERHRAPSAPILLGLRSVCQEKMVIFWQSRVNSSGFGASNKQSVHGRIQRLGLGACNAAAQGRRQRCRRQRPDG